MHDPANTSVSADKLLCALMEVRLHALLVTTPEQFLLLKNSAQAGTAKLFSDHMGRPAGYVAWAEVNSETARIYLLHGLPPSYPYEWREGHLCVLLDLVIVPGMGKAARAQLRSWLRTRRALLFTRKKRHSAYRRGKRLALHPCLR
jgi:hemolysin-activating ACP:hemolysin acyltransferase